MNYILLHNGIDVITNAVVKELHAGLKKLAHTPDTVEDVVEMHELAEYAIRKDEKYILVAFDVANAFLDFVEANPNVKVIVNATTHDAIHGSIITQLLKYHRPSVHAVLTPIHHWFSDTPPDPADNAAQLVLANTLVANVKDITYIKYLGTIPETLKPIKSGPQTGIGAFIINAQHDYDWCFVMHALNSYAVTLYVPASRRDALKAIIPEPVLNHPDFELDEYASIEDLVACYDECTAIVALPTISGRILKAADFSYLLPTYMNRLSYNLQEVLHTNISTSILGTSDINTYDTVYAEVVTGILDPQSHLDKIRATITSDTYPGLTVSGDSRYNLLNIVTTNKYFID